MKPHIVTEDMRLRAQDGQELEGKLYLPRDGVVSRLVVQVNGSGPQTCNTFRDRGDRTTYSLRLLWGGACRPGTGLLLLQHPRVHRWGSGSTLLPSGPGGLPLLHPSDLWPTWRTGPPSFRPTPRCAGAELLLLGVEQGTMIAPAVAAGGRYPWPDCCWRATPTGPWRRPWTGSSGGWGCTPCSASILTPTEMGASPGRSLRQGRERCRRPWRRPSPGWTWTGTAGSPGGPGGGMPGAGRRSSGPSRRGRRVALGTLPSPPHHQLVPGPPEVSPQPGDPAPSGPAHPYPPGRWDANTPAEDALAIQETFRRLGRTTSPSTSTLTQDTPWALSSIWPPENCPPPSPISLSCARGWDDRTGAGGGPLRLPLFPDSGAGGARG